MSTIDLHSHSTASDGTLSPAALVERAHARGVRMLALTDHDTTAGLDEAARAAAEFGIELIPGIELSTEWSKRSMHIVGLGVDPAAPELRRLIDTLTDIRKARVARMAESLGKVGIAGAQEGAYRLADGGVPTRTHFARFLVEQGVAPDVGAVFKRYLVPGRPGYASTQWPDLSEGVAALLAAGGIAVLAHPHSYGWTGAWSRRILDEFIARGGRAVEVSCGNSNQQSLQTWSGYARRFDLLASMGSDFHSPGGFIELGRMPTLPQGLSPVWEALS
jgi:predicted metal-dependent phosphoesterase TrpH